MSSRFAFIKREDDIEESVIEDFSDPDQFDYEVSGDLKDEMDWSDVGEVFTIAGNLDCSKIIETPLDPITLQPEPNTEAEWPLESPASPPLWEQGQAIFPSTQKTLPQNIPPPPPLTKRPDIDTVLYPESSTSPPPSPVRQKRKFIVRKRKSILDSSGNVIGYKLENPEPFRRKMEQVKILPNPFKDKFSGGEKLFEMKESSKPKTIVIKRVPRLPRVLENSVAKHLDEAIERAINGGAAVIKKKPPPEKPAIIMSSQPKKVGEVVQKTVKVKVPDESISKKLASNPEVPTKIIEKPPEENRFLSNSPESLASETKVEQTINISLEKLSGLMKMLVPHPWMVATDSSHKSMQVFKMAVDLNGPSVQTALIVPQQGNISLKAMGQELSYDHPVWTQFCSDPASSTGLLKATVIIELVIRLIKSRICEAYSPSSKCEVLVNGRRRCENCEKTKNSPPKSSPPPILSRDSKKAVINKKVEQSSPRKRRTLLPATKPVKQPSSLEASRETSPFEEEDRLEKRSNELAQKFERIRTKLVAQLDRLTIENEPTKVPRTQDEVLAVLGLTRKVEEEATLRKSKRGRKRIFDKRHKELEELRFLTGSWKSVKALFVANLQFGHFKYMETEKMRPSLQYTGSLLKRWHRTIDEFPGFQLEASLEPLGYGDLEKLSTEELRTTLSSSVRQLRTLKTSIKAACPIFAMLVQSELPSDD